MKRSSLLLGVAVSLLSMGALAATKGAAPAEKPAATAPAKKAAKKAPKQSESKEAKKAEPSGT